MSKSREERLLEEFEREEAERKKMVEGILWKEGHRAADQRQAGFRVMQYTALTFVYFDDPGELHEKEARQAKMKQYQEALSKHGITLDYYNDDLSGSYLCG